MTANTEIKTYEQRMSPQDLDDWNDEMCSPPVVLALQDEVSELRAALESSLAEQERMIDKIGELHQRVSDARSVSQPVGAVVATLKPYDFWHEGIPMSWYRKEDVDAHLAALVSQPAKPADGGGVVGLSEAWEAYRGGKELPLDHAFLFASGYRAALAAQPVKPAEGYATVPINPSAAMLKAMAESRAIDDEGEFPAMLDLLDFSGENKTLTVLEAAYVAAITAKEKP